MAVINSGRSLGNSLVGNFWAWTLTFFTELASACACVCDKMLYAVTVAGILGELLLLSTALLTSS